MKFEKHTIKSSEEIKKEALEKAKQKISIVNIDEMVNKEKNFGADTRMNEPEKERTGFKGFLKNLWKHTYAEGYYRGRELKRVEKEIKETGNIYAGQEKDVNASDNAKQAIAERFTSEYEEVLSKGEERKILDEKDPIAVKTKEGLDKLLTDYATGSIDDIFFFNAKNKIIEGLKEDELLKGAENYADNLFEVAKNGKIAFEHGAKMEELDFDTNAILGKARSSIKTEANIGLVDKFFDKVRKDKVGRFLTPAVVSTSVGIVYSIAVATGQILTSNKIVQGITAGGTLGATVFLSAGLISANKSRDVEDKMRLERAQMIKGGKREKNDKQREEMEKYLYETQSAQVLTENLKNNLFIEDENGKHEIKDIKPDDLDKILVSLSDVQARYSLGDKKNIDLVSYSSNGTAEKESFELRNLLGESKAELRKKFENQQDLKNKLPAGETFDSYFEKLVSTMENSFLGGEKGIDSKNKAFKGAKARKVAKTAALSIAFGFAIGGAIQEIAAHVGGHVHGVIDSLRGQGPKPGQTLQTPFERIYNMISGNSEHMSSANLHEVALHGGVLNNLNHVKMPEGTNILQNSDGTFNVLRGDQVVSSHIPLNFNPENGALDQTSVAKLAHDGIIASSVHHTIETTKEVTTNANQYINGPHGHEVMPIARDFPAYDNNTPMVQDPITHNLTGADFNETGIRWDGTTGLDTNNNVVVNLSSMTESGSFHEALSANAPGGMKNGTVEAMIYLTKDLQNMGIKAPPIIDGKMTFNMQDPLWKQLFTIKNGHVQNMNAKFLEVFQHVGNKNGVEHIRPISTLVGHGLDSIKETIHTIKDNAINYLNFKLDTQMPFFIPVSKTNALGQVKYEDPKRQPPETILVKKDGKEKVIPENPDRSVIETGPWSGEEIKKETIETISSKEYGGMEDDIKMLNKKIRESEGIITLEEGNFKSDYGKKRYNELKSIPDGKPVTFNKTELQQMGDEMEEYLTKTNIKEIKQAEETKIKKKIFESLYKSKVSELENGLRKAEKEKNEKEYLKIEAELKKFTVEREEKIKSGDFSYGSESVISKFEESLKEKAKFEDKYFDYQVIGFNSLGNPKVERIDKETKQKKTLTMTKKKLQRDYEDGDIKFIK